MIARSFAVLVFTALLVLLTTPVAAQSICNTRAVIVQQLRMHFDEAPVARGTAGDQQQLVELWLSPARSWTITVTTGRRVCVVASGQGWGFVAPPPEPGDDS